MAGKNTIVFGADTGGAEQGIKRIQKGLRDAGDDAGRLTARTNAAAAATKGLGDHAAGMGERYLKSLLSVTAIVGALRQVAAAQDAVTEARIRSASAAAGPQATAAPAVAALVRAGTISAEDAGRLSTQIDNSADREGAAGLISKIAGRASTDRPFARRVKERGIAGALGALESGVFSPDEIEERLAKGGRFDVGERLSALPPEMRAAINRKRSLAIAGRGASDQISAREEALRAQVQAERDNSVFRTAADTVTLGLSEAGVRAKRRAIMDSPFAKFAIGDFGDLRQSMDPSMLSKPVLVVIDNRTPQINSQGER